MGFRGLSRHFNASQVSSRDFKGLQGILRVLEGFQIISKISRGFQDFFSWDFKGFYKFSRYLRGF